jgi:catalase
VLTKALRRRLPGICVRYCCDQSRQFFVQRADPDDDVTDASVTWPHSRAEIPFGTITLVSRVDDQVPLTEVRADIYLLSGRRRRAASGDGRRAA